MHLTVKYSSKRQKVKYATQLFSHTNSCALNRMGMLGMLNKHNWKELSELLKTSLTLLFECLKDKFEAEYILTYRQNQDMLEMFFGVIRAKGGLYEHPCLLEFKYCLRSYLVGRNEELTSDGANVESFIEREANMGDDVMFGRKCVAAEDYIQVEDEDAEAVVQDIDDVKYDALEYLAGYLLNRFKGKVHNLLDIYTVKMDKDATGLTCSDVLVITEGGIHKPNILFMSELEQLDYIFKKLNGSNNELETGTNYIKAMLDLILNSPLKPDIIKTFLDVKCTLEFDFKHKHCRK